MIRIRFFGPGELNQNYFRAAQYLPSDLSKVTTRSLLCDERLLSTRISNVLLLVGVVFGPALLS